MTMNGNGCFHGPKPKERTPKHSTLVRETFARLQDIRTSKKVIVDGESLDIATVVGVSKYAVRPELHQSASFRRRIEKSEKLLGKLLEDGETIYGVNTGFGGSAGTRSNRFSDLQSALLQHHHFGVLNEDNLPADSSLAMPKPWVRGTMLVRANSVARGHSAVSLEVIETIMSLLEKGFTPVIPLRGSISASGDLSPLSYIAGAVTGNPDISVQGPDGICSADEALEKLGITPAILGPKEGLGLMNGTAASVAVASIALYEAHHIAVLSQVLTAMATEAIRGSVANFDPFISKVRPHRGQTESAGLISLCLDDSQLTRSNNDGIESAGLLYQDRYALRTASQWIGPQLEDLVLAHEQISVELNSTTDNPLIDVDAGKTHHCGNFQAVSVTSAMEKTRSALQMIGKIMFAQCTELMNPVTNNGLPPNLAADEPSTSFTMKGVDIGMASYMSELAFLAHPVSNHVQSAEMHNQAINSLALISARYTDNAVELASLMSASYLYAVCQALDLRVRQTIFLGTLKKAFIDINSEDGQLGSIYKEADLPDFEKLQTRLWDHIESTWYQSTQRDSEDRVNHIVNTALAIITEASVLAFEKQPYDSYLGNFTSGIADWRQKAKETITKVELEVNSRFSQHQDTPQYLGFGSRKMYLFVRETLGVPFHQGLIDHPTPTSKFAADGSRKKTIGSWISVIYKALRDGRLHAPLDECLAESE